ncbi:acyltransferase family protein [Pseudomonadota bacterium]
MTEPNRFPYRPDVDGLRAVAVLAVVMHHLNGSLIPGGFVGVDIFFVISGFVVTQSILRTQSGNALHDLVSFWKRRWLRIIPALLFMLLVTSLVFIAFFAPIPLETFNATLRTGLVSAFGLSNFYLLRLSSDYFQADQSINVFLHTWSLGVEEQFYLVFSVLVIAIPGLLFRRWYSARIRIFLLIALFIGSLWLFLSLYKQEPMVAYYMLPARFWEMALGSVIAFSYYRIISFSPARWLLNGMQLCAVGMMIYALFIYPDPDVNFAMPILLATGATALMIVAGSFQHPSGVNVVTAVLSLRVFVYIGLLSYSIYLWHWPILIFFRYTIGLGVALNILLALSLVFLMSVISYRYVEQKWRGSKTLFLKRLAPQFATVFSLVILVTALPQLKPGLAYAGATQAWSVDWRREHGFAYGNEGKILAFECSLVAGSAIPDRISEKCFSEKVAVNLLEEESSGHQDFPLAGKLILIGDSHSFASWPMASYGREQGAFDMAVFGHDGCGPFGLNERKSLSCQKYLKNLPAVLQRELDPGDAVLVSFYMPFGKSGPYPFADKFLRGLAQIASQNRAIVIIEAPLPRFARPAYLCTPEWFRLDDLECKVPRADYENDRRFLLSWLEKMKQDYAGIMHVWDPVDILCGDECLPFKGDKPIFRDSNHLSYFGATSLGPDFIQFLRTVNQQNTEVGSLVSQ